VTADDPGKAFGQLADGMERVAREVTAASLADALATARGLSRGRYTSRQLRALGHPYRHGGTPPQDPAIINIQSGAFLAAWEIVPSADGTGGMVVNRSPQAEWLRAGTSRMIARPTVERVEEEVGPRHLERAERALLALFGG
jgi:hypothetical protein